MWHTSVKNLGNCCSLNGFGNSNLDLLKEQYQLEYQEKFLNLKNSFFEKYLAEADNKFLEFMYNNSLSALKFEAQKLFNKVQSGIYSEKNPNIQGTLGLMSYVATQILGYYPGSGLHLQNEILSIIDGRISVIETGIIIDGGSSIGLVLTDTQEFLNENSKYKSNLEKMLELLAITIKSEDDYTRANQLFNSSVQNYDLYESEVKDWIDRWKSQGIEVESLEQMKAKIEAQIKAQLEAEKNVNKTQDVVVTNQETVKENIQEKKSKVPLLVGGAAALLFLLGKD